jgi:lysophospholipase L1-like esterase
VGVQGFVELEIDGTPRKSAEPTQNVGRELREATRLPAVNTRGRLISGLVTTVMALAGFVTAGVLPAAAAPSTVQYVALGDSYAAGTASQLGGCPHGPDNYPELLDGSEESRIDLTAFAACSGWTTSDVLDDDGQPSPLSSHTRLVTLTVGAANLGLSRVLAACANPSTPEVVAACSREIGRVLALLGGDCQEDKSLLYSSLTDLYADVVDEARGARIVVTGYPLLFESPPADDPRAAINEATTRLNCVIERAVAATQATYANIYYVDVTKEFAGHGIVTPITDPDAFIHSQFTCARPSPDCADPEAFHPTAAGYSAYADAISAALPRGWLDKP